MKQFEEENRVQKEGYLLKQGDFIKQWHFRYFVLSKECLCYYKTEDESKCEGPKEIIFFNDMSVYVEDLPEKRKKYCLKIVKRFHTTLKAPRSIVICCSSEEERNAWLSKILQAKAVSLICDRSWVNDSKQRSVSESSSEDSNFDRTTARKVLYRCKRKLSLGSSRASYSFDEFCRSQLKTNLDPRWRNTLMDISLAR